MAKWHLRGKRQPLRSELRGVKLPGVTSASFKMAELSPCVKKTINFTIRELSFGLH